MQDLFLENGGIGYFDVTEYKLTSACFLRPNLGLVFENAISGKKSFIVKLENIISFTEGKLPEKIYWLRVDPDGSSFGLDVAVRLKDMSIANYQVLYLFEDLKHSSPTFRAIAEKISIEDIKNKDEKVWPFRG